MKTLPRGRLALRGIGRLLGQTPRPSRGGRIQTPAQDPTTVRAWWAMLHRRDMAEASAKHRFFSHESRSMSSCSSSKVLEGDASGKQDITTQGMKNQQDAKEFIPGNAAIRSDDNTSAAPRATLEVVDGKHGTQEIVAVIAHEDCSDDDCQEELVPPTDSVYPLETLPDSSHRDGSIYKNIWDWKEWFCVTDRTETRFEAMMLSEGKDCVIRDGMCLEHRPDDMLQIFSIKLAEVPMDYGSIELYGYIAVRDTLDGSLNYIVSFSRDDPITVKQGCLLNMCGPKRGIHYTDDLLFEYDMRIKTQGHEDDVQLIDGASIINGILDTRDCDAFTRRIRGNGGAIDITASPLEDAVEATIEVFISQVQSSFNLRLGCFTGEMLEEILVFDGAVCESGGLTRSVVAVVMGTGVDLELKVGGGSSIPVHHWLSFNADVHGCSTQEMRTNVSLISVRVTWSTLPWLTAPCA